MGCKKRIDSLLIERGLVETRARAQALVMAGKVAVGGKVIAKAGTLVAEDVEVTVAEPPPFVGRGGIKLDHALSQFGLDVSDKVAVDIGASTGGFTDCLLKRGASRVYAVDVGYGQLDYRLRQDPRVVVMERINARYPFSLPEKADLATFDLSFISVEKVIPSVARLLRDDGYLLVLLKPQFEARKEEVGRGGVVKQPEIQARVLGRFIAWLIEHGFRLGGLVASPIAGASGNREFVVMLRRA
ncbi:MAG: TlyA family RNA methyltransferase [Dehalococcoidales bacterium]|nr:TlyA family RNA methyltransferase [Dehalococcoidales bacterium]